MERSLKFKKRILIGLIFATPIVTFASNKQETITNRQINLASNHLESTQYDSLKHIKHLQNEGAISNSEAEKLIKNNES